jgi:hypothetical protein
MQKALEFDLGLSEKIKSHMQDFCAKINDTASSGAVFFAVCRGKVCILFCKLVD